MNRDNGGIIGKYNPAAQGSAGGFWNLGDSYTATQGSRWPQPGLGVVLDILTVAGGGGGGDRHGGGGGAGGYLAFESFVPDFGFNYVVTVGAGGVGGNYESNNSSPRGSGLIGGFSRVQCANDSTDIYSYGGGGGGTYDGNPTGTFGSGGGGGGANRPGIAGTAGQGNSGGDGANPSGGGGGGAGQVGYAASSPGHGGNGLQWLDGNYYAGGGGGGGTTTNGGLGGGGMGAFDYGYTDGEANTGGGGGGTRSSNTATIGANGGSGVVIFRIMGYTGSIITTGSPTITVDGSYTYYKFTSSGTLTF